MPPILVPTRVNPPRKDHYGRFMTLCVSAITMEKKIVAVCDFMLSTPITSVETRAEKISRVGHTGKWISMYAGDPSFAKFIASESQADLQDKDEGCINMINTFVSSYQRRIQIQIEHGVLSPYGMNRERFLKEGRAAFGDEEFSRIVYQINAVRLETECLIAGFDSSGPHLFSVNDPGTTTLHDFECFHAIGCGAPLANAALISSFDPFRPLTDIIYLLLDAKFRSEKAPGVGQRTIAVVLCEDGNLFGINPGKVEAIKELRKAKNRHLIPPEAHDMINGMLVPRMAKRKESKCGQGKRPARTRAPRPESGVESAQRVYSKFLAKADPTSPRP